jgi:membrane protein
LSSQFRSNVLTVSEIHPYDIVKKLMEEILINIWDLIRKTFHEWNDDNAAQLAAAIAYYTLFSITPLLIIALAIAGYFFNIETARSQLMAQIGEFIGPKAADFVKTLLDNSARSSDSLAASMISIGVTLVGASGVFNEVQYALNKVWDVPLKPQRGIVNTLKMRFISFLMVLAVGFLLLVFLLISTLLPLLSGYISGGSQTSLLPGLINFIVLFIMITMLTAIVYRVIPEKDITWTDVWLGAAVTALLFMIGRYAIGLYLTISKPGSTYGAAGALIVLLIWIYYSAQIFLLGAEFTQVYSSKFGSHKQLEG